MRRRLLRSSLALALAALLALALPLAIAVRGVLEARALDALQGSVEQFALVLDVTTRSCSELQLRVTQVGDAPAEISVLTVGGGLLVTTSADGRTRVGAEFADATAGRIGRRVGAGQLAVAVPLSTLVCGRPVVLHATQPDTALRGQVQAAWILIAGVGAAVAGAAAGGAWWLGRRLAQPFEALAGSARRLGQGDFSARATRSGLPEADDIAAALDDTAARLGRAVERSTAFTADASHQLRTPLTALRLQLETLEAMDPDRPEVRAALTEADRLEATIDDLVTLTRVDGPDVEADLGAMIAERLPGWRALAAEHDRRVDVEVLPVPAVRVRPAAIAQALQVLLDNALEHGTGTITVRLTPARPDEPDASLRLEVLDEGPVHGTLRAAPAAERSRGRGLPLARALVAGEGGQLTVSATPSGTCAMIVLPTTG